MKNFLVRRLLFGLLTLTIVASAICTTTRPASAIGAEALQVNVANDSDRAVWYIVFWSYPAQDWHIENSFCVPSKKSRMQTVAYAHPWMAQVRLEAQVKKDANNCGGPSDTVQTHTWEDKKDVFRYPHTLDAVLLGQNGNYFFRVEYHPR